MDRTICGNGQQQSNSISEVQKNGAKLRHPLRDKSDVSRKYVLPSLLPPLSQTLDQRYDTVEQDASKCLSLPATATEGTKKKIIPATDKKQKNDKTDKTAASKAISKSVVTDIIDIFKVANKSKMRSKQLLGYLCSDPEKPWATYCRGRALTYQRLSALLVEFGIYSRDIRFKKGVFKGYQKKWFDDARRCF